MHLTFADPWGPTQWLGLLDHDPRAANSLELPGLQDPQNSVDVAQSPAGTRPQLLAQVQSDAPRGPGVSQASAARLGLALASAWKMGDWATQTVTAQALTRT